ncbi:MAG: AAA family ATPase [Nanobdellota archaeon]
MKLNKGTVTFMKTWYETLGYYHNPFLQQTMKEQYSYQGNEQLFNDIVYYIQSGNILFVKGTTGSGKTRLLKEITRVKPFKGKLIYVPAKTLSKTFDIEQILRKKNGLKGKIAGTKPKGNILLLDDAQELSKVNTQRLKYYFDQGYLKSIVFTGTDLKGFTKSMINRIGKRVFSIPTLKQEQIIDTVFERLDENKEDEDAIITPTVVKQACEKANNNIKTVFELLDNAFNTMIKEERTTMTTEDIEKAVTPQKETTTEKELVDEKGRTVLKIGEYYRRPSKEMFCSNCGAIVTEQDEYCPECQAEFETEEEDETEETKQSKDNTNDIKGDN